MSLLERSASQQAPVAEERPHSDRLRVIMAGRVGDMQARLATSGFDVVAVAETEDALIDAMSADEADAIVVEADLCASLEHVRDLAPDALLIAVGDHTPAGALGRIERGVSGTSDGWSPARPRCRRRRSSRCVGPRARVSARGRAARPPAHGRIAAVGESGSRPVSL